MNETTTEMIALIKIMTALTAAVKEAGEQGAPSGPMYAAVMTHGVSLEQYQRMMGVLVNAGILRLSNHVYYYIE